MRATTTSGLSGKSSRDSPAKTKQSLERCSVREGEAVGHAGKVVGDPVRELTLTERQSLGFDNETVEDRMHHLARATMLGLYMRP